MIHSSTASLDAPASRRAVSSSAGVRTTSTATSMGLPTGHPVHHAEAAPGQPGIDAEHPHVDSQGR